MGLQDFDTDQKPYIELGDVRPLVGPSLDSGLFDVDPKDVVVEQIGENLGGFVQVNGIVEGKGPVTFYIATQSEKPGQ